MQLSCPNDCARSQRRLGIDETAPYAEAADEVFASFPDQFFPFDVAAATVYAAVVAERDRIGAPIDGFDAQIAAICRARRALLATRNIKDFRDTGVELVDPWQYA